MSARRPVINVTGIVTDLLRVEPRASYDGERPVHCQINTAFAANAEGEHEFSVRLVVRFHDEDDIEAPNLPYVAEIAVIGYFSSGIKIGKDAIPAPLAVNALNIIYGVMRGVLGQITSTFHYGAFVAPAIVFDQLVDRASRTEGTAIVPAPSSIRPDEPNAPEVFRFLFAMEDFRRILPALPKQRRQRIEERLESLGDLLNALPTRPESITEAIVAARTLRVESERLGSPLAPLLNVWADAIVAALERMGMRMHSEQNATKTLSP